MIDGGDIERGPGVLRRLLGEQMSDLRTLDLDGFRVWLARQLERWAGDPVFVQRTRVRDLRRANRQVAAAEAAHREAVAADEASPQFARLRDIEQEARAAGQAVAGITAALESAAHPAALLEKRDAFQAKLRRLEDERAVLVAASPERQAVLTAAEGLDAVRGATGLDREEDRLRELLAARGHRSDRTGSAFEGQAAAAVERFLLPELAGGPDGVRVLSRVTLGAAQLELDQVAVRVPPGEVVEVLAVVEAKRNANDLAHGFLRRQANLAWLSGERGGYDPAAMRTRTFPTGHFDRPAVHQQGREAFRFGPGSFRRFRRDPATGWYLGGLCLVTRSGPLWGLSGTALARVSHRVATDEQLDLADPADLAALFDWCRGLAGELEAPDVLRAYLASADDAGQVLVVGR